MAQISTYVPYEHHTVPIICMFLIRTIFEDAHSLIMLEEVEFNYHQIGSFIIFLIMTQNGSTIVVLAFRTNLTIPLFIFSLFVFHLWYCSFIRLKSNDEITLKYFHRHWNNWNIRDTKVIYELCTYHKLYIFFWMSTLNFVIKISDCSRLFRSHLITSQKTNPFVGGLHLNSWMRLLLLFRFIAFELSRYVARYYIIRICGV